MTGNGETRRADEAREFESLGGDPVCWLDRVCTECGAFLEGEPRPEGIVCWRCGRLQPLEA